MRQIINISIGYILYIKLYCLASLPIYPQYAILSLINCFINYRKEIILKNIKIVFPFKNKGERIILLKKFYSRLYTVIIEIIKSIHFNQKEIIKRVQIDNESDFKQILKQDKSFILVASHYGNWEWLLLRISLIKTKKIVAVYKPLSNRYLNKIMLNIRQKFNATLIPIDKWNNFILKNRNKDYIYFLVSDQNPNISNKSIQTLFFNKKTHFNNGPEKMHKLLNSEVFYIDMQQQKCGYYNVSLKKITNNDVTKTYASLLETTIKRKPELWLWSHNRWKQ